MLKAHDLPIAPIEGLTPGTNAVFAVGGVVVKLFAPIESSFDTLPDFRVELAAMQAASSAGVPAPAVIASGLYRDRYDFYYIIMEHANARDAREVLPAMSRAEKNAFAARMRKYTDALHALALEPQTGDVYLRAAAGPRHAESGLPHSFREALPAEIARLRRTHCGKEVFVHGDLTEDNVLLGDGGDIHIIDFADARHAPAFYELAPLFFGLFGCDLEMLKSYLPGYSARDLAEAVADSLCLHEFGMGIIADVLCERTRIPVSRIESPQALRRAVAALMGDGMRGNGGTTRASGGSLS